MPLSPLVAPASGDRQDFRNPQPRWSPGTRGSRVRGGSPEKLAARTHGVPGHVTPVRVDPPETLNLWRRLTGSLSMRALPPVHAAEPIVAGERRVQAALSVYSSRLASSDRGRRLRSDAFPRSRRSILDCHVDKRCESMDGADRRLRGRGRCRRRSALRLAQPRIRLRACLRRLHRVVRGEDLSHAFVGRGRAPIRIGMALERAPRERPPELVLRRGGRDAEHVVRGAHPAVTPSPRAQAARTAHARAPLRRRR
jgi:hypothetical protein